MGATGYCKRLVSFHQTARYLNPEDILIFTAVRTSDLTYPITCSFIVEKDTGYGRLAADVEKKCLYLAEMK
jgi:hypothetical protein